MLPDEYAMTPSIWGTWPRKETLSYVLPESLFTSVSIGRQGPPLSVSLSQILITGVLQGLPAFAFFSTCRKDERSFWQMSISRSIRAETWAVTITLGRSCDTQHATNKVLSRPIYMFVQFVILLWRGFYVKILEWNVNNSASRLYVYAPKVVQYHLQFFADFTRVNIKYISHFSVPTFPYFNSIIYKMRVKYRW